MSALRCPNRPCPYECVLTSVSLRVCPYERVPASAAGAANAIDRAQCRASCARAIQRAYVLALQDAARRAIRPVPEGIPLTSLTHPRAQRLVRNGENQSEESGRRDGRRRDDPHHLASHQGEADPSLPRCAAAPLRPRHPEEPRNA